MSVARHTAYNLVGAIIPIGVTLLTVPLYLQLIGPSRYGILAIFWTITGSLGFLSLGMGPALTQQMAATRHATAAYRSQLVWTALAPTLAASVAGIVMTIAIGHLYFEYFAATPSRLEREIEAALPYLAASIPVALTGSVIAGALQARQQFLVLNAIQVCGNVLSSVLPLVAAWTLGPELHLLVMATIVGNFLGLIASTMACRRSVPLYLPGKIRRGVLLRLLRFGGWVSVTTFLAPFVLFLDRFLIGALRSPAALAAYVIPANFVQRLLLLPVSMTNALIPHLAASKGSEQDRLQERSLDTLTALLTPMAIGGIAILAPFLFVWLGPRIAAASAPPGIILALGYWIHGIAHVATSTLFGRAKPEVITKIVMVTIIPYAFIAYLLIDTFGIVGAAIAWVVRASTDGLQFAWSRPPRKSMQRAFAAALLVVTSVGFSLSLDWRSAVFWIANGVLLVMSLLLYLPTWKTSISRFLLKRPLAG